MDSTHNKDNTKAIIIFGFLAVFSLMGLAIAMSISTLNSANDEMSAVVEDNTAKINLAFLMRDAIRLRSGATMSLIQIWQPELRTRIFDQLVYNTESYNNNRMQLIAMGASMREEGALRRISNADARAVLAYDKAHENIFNKHHKPEMTKTVLADVQLHELVLLNHLKDLILLEKTLSKEILAGHKARYRETQSMLLLFILAAIGASILILGLVIKRVSRANQEIAFLASHDDLTGLKNRRSFEGHLKDIVATCQHSPSVHALIYFDLDRFKIVNDTCGHHAGDQLLIEITSMIKFRLRPHDMLARVGGDEFAIIATSDSMANIERLAEDIRVLIHKYTFSYEEQEFHISLSIGLIQIDGQETDIEAILGAVDSACYVAKEAGRNRVHVKQKNDVEIDKYRSDIAGVQTIRSALAENRLVLFYQPVYKILEDGVSMAHCEILLRLQNEQGQLVSPAAFIPIAEKYNIMTDIDRWVLSHAIDWVVAHQYDYEVPRLLINLSGLSFIDEDFLEFVAHQLQSREVDPSKIAFEITETAAVDNTDKANVFVDRIRALGCRFALDDFGSGFSTFAYLKKFQLDYLKIDGSLVKNLATDHIDREMVRAINEIGHTVNAKTIAEFVEDDATLEYLRSIGVDYAQGYGLHKPCSIDELPAQLKPITFKLKNKAA